MRVTVATDKGTDVSRLIEALKRDEHDVDSKVVDSKFLSNLTADIVFNYSRRFPGRHGNAFLPTLLDSEGIPYTGSDALTHALCQDRFSCRTMLRNARTPILQHVIVYDPNDCAQSLDAFQFPIVVKYNHGPGAMFFSSRSEFFEVIEEIETWPIIIDEYIDGRELVVYGFGNGVDTQFTIPLELTFDGPIMIDKASSFNQASLTKQETSMILDITKRSYHVLGLSDFARFDIRLNRNHIPYIIEVDPNPAFDIRMDGAAQASSLTHDDMAVYVLNLAIQRVGSIEHNEKQLELF